jgi:hypothetical protein
MPSHSHAPLERPRRNPLRLYEHTGIIPVHRGASESFTVNLSIQELFKRFSRALRDRFERVFAKGMFRLHDIHVEDLMALSVSEAFDFCRRLEAVSPSEPDPMGALRVSLFLGHLFFSNPYPA